MAILKDVPTRLRMAAQLFEERNKAYGSNYRHMGAVMAAMYPQGLTVRTPEDWTRLMLQVHRVTKETRYACNFERNGHQDSLADLAVYAIMAAETDELATGPSELDIPEITIHTGTPPFRFALGNMVRWMGRVMKVRRVYTGINDRILYDLEDKEGLERGVSEAMLLSSMANDPPEAEISDEWQKVLRNAAE